MIHPASDCLVRNCNSALREQILDITEAEGEPEIEPDRLAHDLLWEAISGVADFRHALRLPSRRRRDNAAGTPHSAAARKCRGPATRVCSPRGASYWPVWRDSLPFAGT